MSTLKSPSFRQGTMTIFRSSYFFGPSVVDLILSSLKNTILNLDSLTLKAVNPEFSASMIEVPLLTPTILLLISWFLMELNIFILMLVMAILYLVLLGLEKLKYISSHHPDIATHVHLMVNDPLGLHSPLNYVEQYASAGATAIAIHPRVYQQ